MTIIWITPKITVGLVKHFHLKIDINPLGGWLELTSQKLICTPNFRLVICFENQGSESIPSHMSDNGYEFFSIHNDDRIGLSIESMLNKLKPDFIHIFGTESDFVRKCGNICCDNGYSDRMAIWIQGLKYEYAKHYMGGIPDIQNKITIRDILRKDSLKRQEKRFIKEGEEEIALLKKISVVTGRTDWDLAHTTLVNDKLKYVKINETMRKSFYEQNWDISKIDRHSIFVSQSHYPIKGFHWIIEALYIIKQHYPDTKLYVSGSNNAFVEGIKVTAYGKYVQKLKREYGLEDNIEYIGMLDEEGMMKRYLKSHVYVSSSSIENSPNSVCEAMLLGMPVVSSYVGGIADLLVHGKEGYLYQYDAPYMLAYYVLKLFDNDYLAVKLGKSAREHAKATHDPEKNFQRLLSLYRGYQKKEREGIEWGRETSK